MNLVGPPVDSPELSAEQRLPRVLVVEDNDGQRQTLCNILGEEGVEPVGCASAAEAIDRVLSEDFSVAIVDLRLPDMAGTEVLKRLRAMNDGIRVIIHTAYASFDSAKDSVNLGAFAYVEKLGHPEELIGQVHRALEDYLGEPQLRGGPQRSASHRPPRYSFQIDWSGIAPWSEKLLQKVLGEHIRLETIQPPGIHPVYAKFEEVEQVILTLVLNARDAMPRGGKLTLAVENLELDSSQAEALDLEPGAYVTITISDTGIGMDGVTQDHIFEPAFSTHPLGDQDDLGLSEVLASVKRIGGTISVESEPGKGSSFRVYFPAACLSH